MECPWDRANNWAWERGPSKSGSNFPTPRVPSVPHHVRWFILAHCVCFLSPTLLWAAKDDLFPHIGGAVSHQAPEFICIFIPEGVFNHPGISSLGDCFFLLATSHLLGHVCSVFFFWKKPIVFFRLKLKFSCMMELSHFPLDEQVCTMEIASCEYNCWDNSS